MVAVGSFVVVGGEERGVWIAQVGTVIAMSVVRRKRRRGETGDRRGRRCVAVVVLSRGIAVTRKS